MTRVRKEWTAVQRIGRHSRPPKSLLLEAVLIITLAVVAAAIAAVHPRHEETPQPVAQPQLTPRKIRSAAVEIPGEGLVVLKAPLPVVRVSLHGWRPQA